MAIRGSLPTRSPDQLAWLFQASPQHFQLGQELSRLRPGDRGKWNVRQNRDLMRPEQPVLFWQSGPQAGIYGVAHLTGTPEYGAVTEAEWPTEWWVDWELDAVLEPHISRESLKLHPVLSQMHVMRVPRGTNFKLTAEEWDAFVELLSEDY